VRWPLLIPALSLALGVARGGERVEVISPRADSVSVTIYRDLFALITETRTVDLPEGPTTLSFDGVVETLLPASAVVADLGRELEERNYDYEQLTPRSLMARSVGREVLLMRTLPGGKVVRSPATIVSASDDGVVLRTGDGTEALRCSGLPEHVVFERVPDELRHTPRLSVRLAAGPAGRRTIRLSYLAHGFAWKSDYVARLDRRATHVDLKGWVTLRNLTQTSIQDAQVQVVAGRPNLLNVEDGGSSLLEDNDYYDERVLRAAREDLLQLILEEFEWDSEQYDGHPSLLGGCFPVSPAGPHRLASEDIGLELEEVVVTGLRGSLIGHEPLADYQLYRLPWRTDLRAQQTKQALFLAKRSVKVERYYSSAMDAFHGSEDEPALEAPMLTLAFDNRKSSGLGEPLPEGILRLFEPGPAGDLFSGEGEIGDTAVNEPVEVALAGAVDLKLDVRTDTHEREADSERAALDIATAEIRIENAKGVPVTVEIRQQMHEHNANAAVARASQRPMRKHGDLAWRIRVPANSGAMLSYELHRPQTDAD
jgi:hypothetical protein